MVAPSQFPGTTQVAGAYTLTWNSVALGIFEMQGEEGGLPGIELVDHAQVVKGTDQYAQSPIGGFLLGGEANWQGTAMEYTKAIAALWPWGIFGEIGIPGRDLWDLSKALVMTAVPNTPAASITGGVSTLTALHSIKHEEFPSKLLFGPVLRKVPLKLRLYLYQDGSSRNVFFSTT